VTRVHRRRAGSAGKRPDRSAIRAQQARGAQGFVFSAYPLSCSLPRAFWISALFLRRCGHFSRCFAQLRMSLCNKPITIKTSAT